MYMLPGDHFEQLYRYSLPRYNLLRGVSPYDSGYQYNLSKDGPAFSEGWVFFPFSIIHAAFATVLGDVAAYNVIALFSFPLVGGAMYLLIFTLTASHAASLLSSLLLALLPHRTSFLFGEMAYGVDLVWPPLIVFAFEQLARTLQKRYIFAFGVCLFLYSTSNFQGFYLFSVFSAPYFFVRSVQVFSEANFQLRKKVETASLVVLSLAPALVYLLFIRNLLGISGLSTGQSYSETRFYSPLPINAVQVWSGNEKTVYLGWPLFGVMAFFLVIGISGFLRSAREVLSSSNRAVFVLAGLVFIISYAFCFGPNLDSMLGVKIYHLYFKLVPGANGTRTPGRLMNTAGFFFALLFGMQAHVLIATWETKAKTRCRRVWIGTLLATIVIISGYHYTNPLMVKLEAHNEAYEKIKNTSGVVYSIPTQIEAPHYFNATFMYYAQKYNLKMFVGHSSMYPREWDQIISSFLPINLGRFDRAMMERFKERGITHLVAHATDFEPNVNSMVIARLYQSPFLRPIGEEAGVHVFEVNFDATGDQMLNPEKLLSMLKDADFGKLHLSEGWHARETYPGQRSFRWMDGQRADAWAFQRRDFDFSSIEFAYQCPLQELEVSINGKRIVADPLSLEGRWKKFIVNLGPYPERYIHLEFFTSEVYNSPPDVRNFGCQIGDIIIR